MHIHADTKDGEWIDLFDGKSTKGWTPRAKVESFEAKDGQLQLSSKVNVWVVSDLKMADFEVEAEVKIPTDYAGFNSGLGFQFRRPFRSANLDAPNDAQGIHYYTPRFNGFHLALSYRPQVSTTTGGGGGGSGGIS